MCLRVSLFLNNFFARHWRKESDQELDTDPLVRGTDLRIRIRSKMSRILNTGRCLQLFCSLTLRPVCPGADLCCLHLPREPRGLSQPGQQRQAVQYQGNPPSILAVMIINLYTSSVADPGSGFFHPGSKRPRIPNPVTQQKIQVFLTKNMWMWWRIWAWRDHSLPRPWPSPASSIQASPTPFFSVGGPRGYELNQNIYIFFIPTAYANKSRDKLLPT